MKHTNMWKEINTTDGTTWQPQEGSVIEGNYEGVKREVGANKSNIYNIRIEDGTIVGVWGSTVLDNKMSMVPVGEIIKIEYLGVVTNEKSGRDYKDFKVYIQE